MTNSPEIPKKNLIIDASIMSSLMSCGMLTDLRYNHNFISLDGKSNSLEVGSLVHKILEIFNKSIISGAKRSDAIQSSFVAGEMYVRGCQYCTDFEPTETEIKPLCGHTQNEYEGLKNTPQDNEKNKVGWKWAFETMNQYFDFYKNDSWITLEAEVTKGEILYEDDDIRILWKAKLDRVVDTNQGILPVDVKTSKQNRNTLSLNNQFIGQCLLMKTRSMIIDKIGFQTTLEPKDKFSRVIMSYSADRLIEWQSITLPFWAKMYQMYQESEYWPQNFTHCDNKFGQCMYKGICESDRNMREEELQKNFKIGMKWDVFNIDD